MGSTIKLALDIFNQFSGQIFQGKLEIIVFPSVLVIVSLGNDVNIAPLYLNARWYWKDRRWSPFVDMSAGYAFATSTGTGGGAYVAPLVGINYHIKGRLSLDLGLGYLYEGCTYYGMAFNQHSPEIRIGLRY